ncbi:MAG: hypothetical protein ACK4NA_03835 [Alphaproteobacteria bacterium]
MMPQAERQPVSGLTGGLHSGSHAGMSAGPSRLVSFVLLGVAVCGLWLAVPRLGNGLAVAPHTDTLGALGQPSPPSAEAQRRAAAAYERAVAWHDSPEIRAARGAVILAAAARAVDPGAARGDLERSVREHRLALAGSPASPYVWTRLLQGEIALNADPAIIARHLRLALASAPWEPGLITARLGLAFAVWSDLAPADRDAFAPQIRHAARLYPASLARQARARRAQEHVIQALETDPDLLRRFSLAYSRL